VLLRVPFLLEGIVCLANTSRVALTLVSSARDSHSRPSFIYSFIPPSEPYLTAADQAFQEDLHAFFHKLIQVPLPSWPQSRDYLTVWRRTRVCAVDEMTFKDIPVSERVAETVAAPCVQHLL
jgi:hypothetical protein